MILDVKYRVEYISIASQGEWWSHFSDSRDEDDARMTARSIATMSHIRATRVVKVTKEVLP